MTNSPRTVLAGLMPVKFLKAAVVYNLIVMTLFFAVYLAMDFGKHFTSHDPVTTRGKLYFMLMNHTAIGSNDITPKTDTARTVMAMHVLAAWMQLFLVFLP